MAEFFNLTCRVYRTVPGSSLIVLPMAFEVAAQLKASNNDTVAASLGAQTIVPQWSVLVPPLTDIRGYLAAASYRPHTGPTYFGDLLNIPAGSKHWYNAFIVDDAQKGRSVEYRIVTTYRSYGHYDGIDSWLPPLD